MNQRLLYFCAVAILGLLPPMSSARAAWDIGTLATAGDVGKYCHARVDSAGDIHVVYIRDDTDEIHVISQAGGVWQTPQVVDPAGSANGPCAISADGAGVLRCVWQRGGTVSLVYAGPEEVHSWEIGNVTIDPDRIGVDLSIERRPTGEVGVACRNDTDESLVLIKRDASGVWAPPEVVDPGPGRGFYVDLTYRPGGGFVFSERDANETALMYADSSLETSEWEIGSVTSSPDNIGPYLSLHRRETGEVSVACRNETRDALVFATRDELGVWSTLDTIDAGPSRGSYCDHTHRPGGGYAFSERDDATTSLLYVDQDLRSHNWKIGTVRTFGDAGKYVSATRMPDGHVACSYYHYDGTTKGSVELAFNVGTADYWAIRTAADSIATTAAAEVTSDLTITSGWEGFVSFHHDITGHLYYAYNDSVTTGIDDDPRPRVGPLAFWLRPNSPNPFNPQTTISYTIRETGPVRLAIYDVSGGLVRTLVDELKPAGDHRVTWDGRNDRGQLAASGVYFLRLSSAGQHRTQKLVLVK
jgi:hypothetical protein